MNLPQALTRRFGRRVKGSVADLPPNVLLLGITSFFADVSTEMIYPIVPIFLTSTLGAPVAAVGLIEGIAESTASLMKLVSGWWSDKVAKRVPLVMGGYGLAACGKIILGLAYSWPIVLLGRFVDRFGKGVRGSPRDALIGDSTPPELRGKAFGLHRSMDTAGAVVGPLLGLGLVALLNEHLRTVFLIAAVPGFLSIASLLLVREVRAASSSLAPEAKAPLTLKGLDPKLVVFLAASLVFALGNSSDIFLILRAKDLGLSTTAAVLAYVVYNFVYMSAAFPAGIVSDKIGRWRVFLLGLLIFAVAYAGFAAADRSAYVWPLFAVYGLYIALTEGVAKAFVTDLAPPERRASLLGLHGMIIGLGALVASVAAGVLWDEVGQWAPFALGAAGAAAAAVMLTGLVLFAPSQRTA
ncbi:MAG TPA: MFS transporter [Dehalococcoidia bacterium]|nr:MFS transporter [Dehalococcoidia bacterium]